MVYEKWNPVGDLIALQDRMNNLVKDALKGANPANDRSALAWSPTMDFFETDKAFILVAEVPGMTTDDIDLQIENNELVISGGRQETSEEKARSYYRRERSGGQFKRAFSLPAPVVSQSVVANLKNGILEVTLPKKDTVSGVALKVKIKEGS